MKSQLFQRLDDSEYNRLRDDLAAVLSAPNETLTAVVRRLPDLHTANRRSFDGILDRFRGDFNGLPVDRIITVLLWIGKNAALPSFAKDSTELWVEDMISLGIAKAEQRDRCIQTIDLVRTEFTGEDAKLKLTRQRAENGLLPRFVDAGVTVELRAMFDSEFSVGEGTSVAYAPRLMGLVPILTLQIDLDAGDPDRLQFQLTHDDLQDFISILHAAQKQLELAAAASQHFDSQKEA